MFDFDIRSVPRFILRDKNGYALAKAIQAAMQIMNDTVEDGVNCITDIDKMPEWRLDELAWELNIEWYDYEYDIEVKRRTVKTFQEVYKRLGTNYAVHTALQAIYPNCEIREWFDYNGTPFKFRLLVDTSDDGVTPDQIQRALDRIQYYRNERSVLDGVQYIISPSEPVTANAAACASGGYYFIGVTINEGGT